MFFFHNKNILPSLSHSENNDHVEVIRLIIKHKQTWNKWSSCAVASTSVVGRAYIVHFWNCKHDNASCEWEKERGDRGEAKKKVYALMKVLALRVSVCASVDCFNLKTKKCGLYGKFFYLKKNLKPPNFVVVSSLFHSLPQLWYCKIKATFPFFFSFIQYSNRANLNSF